MMALRRISSMLGRISGQGNVGAIRNDLASPLQAPDPPSELPNGGLPFMEEAVVADVYDRGGALIHYHNRLIQAFQATDEPLRAGDFVFVSAIKGSSYWLIHGTKK